MPVDFLIPRFRAQFKSLSNNNFNENICMVNLVQIFCIKLLPCNCHTSHAFYEFVCVYLRGNSYNKRIIGHWHENSYQLLFHIMLALRSLVPAAASKTVSMVNSNECET